MTTLGVVRSPGLRPQEGGPQLVWPCQVKSPDYAQYNHIYHVYGIHWYTTVERKLAVGIWHLLLWVISRIMVFVYVSILHVTFRGHVRVRLGPRAPCVSILLGP